MSNPIGTGTCNLSVNVPKDVRTVLGQAAFAADKSLGEFLKLHVIPAGLEAIDPIAAAKVREHLRGYYGALLTVIFLWAFCAGALPDVRRTSTRTRITREEEIRA
jgi:hypothetical protein